MVWSKTRAFLLLLALALSLIASVSTRFYFISEYSEHLDLIYANIDQIVTIRKLHQSNVEILQQMLTTEDRSIREKLKRELKNNFMISDEIIKHHLFSFGGSIDEEIKIKVFFDEFTKAMETYAFTSLDKFTYSKYSDKFQSRIEEYYLYLHSKKSYEKERLNKKLRYTDSSILVFSFLIVSSIFLLIYLRADEDVDYSILKKVFENAEEPTVVVFNNRVLNTNAAGLVLFNVKRAQVLSKKDFSHYILNFEEFLERMKMLDDKTTLKVNWLFSSHVGQQFWADVVINQINHEDGVAYVFKWKNVETVKKSQENVDQLKVLIWVNSEKMQWEKNFKRHRCQYEMIHNEDELLNKIRFQTAQLVIVNPKLLTMEIDELSRLMKQSEGATQGAKLLAMLDKDADPSLYAAADFILKSPLDSLNLEKVINQMKGVEEAPEVKIKA